MRSNKTKSIDSFLQDVQLAVQNGQNIEEVSIALDQYNFTADKFTPAATLLDEAWALHAAQKMAYGEQYAATAALNEAFSAADSLYTAHRTMAKLALRGDAQAKVALLLNEPKSRKVALRIAQAGVFYTNILNDAVLMERVATYGLTAARLNEGETAVNHLSHLNAAQKKAKSAAQTATRTRDDVLNALQTWLSTFRAIAFIALTGAERQYLESLGFGPIA